MDRETKQARRLESLALASVQVPFLWIATDSRVVYTNAAAAHLLGYEPAELLEMSIPDLDPGWTAEFWESDGLRRLREAKLSRFDSRVRRKDGTVIDVEVCVNHVVLDDRQEMLFASFNDISERTTTERALRDSEERLRLALDSGRMGTWDWTVPTGEVYWAPRVERIFGLDPGSFDGRYETYRRATHPDDLSRMESTIERFAQGADHGDYFTFEHRIVTPAGELRWVHATARVHRGDDGQAVRMTGVVVDVTARKRAEIELAETRALLAAAFEQTPAGLLIADAPDVKIRLANSAALAIRGGETADLVDIPMDLHPSRWQCFHADGTAYAPEDLPLSRAVLEGKTSVNEEVMIRRSDGEERWVLADAAPVHDVEGRVRAGVAAFTDITERKSAEEELRHALAEVASLKEQLEAENVYLREEILKTHGMEGVVGESDIFLDVMRQVEQVGPTDASVLLLGETGTGKDVIARAVHRHSHRSDRPFVKVDCAALSATLIESELFGHEKGAYTGALTRTVGRFELADGGTAFLDEIGVLPLELQSKLLRVLQDGEFERLGSPRTQTVDVRFIAATNRDLAQAVEQGTFRADLYYRLSVFPIMLPRLSERREDIPLLVRHFIAESAEKLRKTIERVPSEVMSALAAYDWPGNLRELRNVIERAVIRSPGTTLRIDDPIIGGTPADRGMVKMNRLADVERDHILRVVQDCGWKIRGEENAAAVLGMNPSTLRSRMRKLGISRPGK